MRIRRSPHSTPVTVDHTSHKAVRRGAVRATLAAALAVAGLAACGSAASSASDKPLVVATTTHLADFARVIGGDSVEVYGLLRPNADAHDFDPTPADLDALARADVIVANGVGLEPWLDAAVKASGTSTPVTDTSEGTTLIEDGHDEDDDHAHEGEEDDHGHEGEDDDHAADDDHDHSHDGANPHIWLDPENARVMATNVADAIAAAVPGDAEAIEARAADYDAALVELDTEIADQLADLADRRLVTDHHAFPYFAARYDLVVVGTIIPSFDSAAEVSAGDLQDLAATMEDQGVRAVFTEQSLPPDAAEALARLVDVTVVSGEDGLFSDSLGPEGSAGATYLDMMRHNATTIERHLG